MEDLSIVNAAVLPIAYALTEAGKNVLGDQPWFHRILPLVPVLLCFALSFIPGLGLATAPIGTKLLFALGAGGLTGTAYEMRKRALDAGSGSEGN